MEDASIWTQILSEVMPGLVAAIGGALTLLVVWMRSKTKALIDNKIEHQAVESALNWLNGIVWDAVAAAKQVTVDGLKRDLADGKISKEEYQRLLGEVKAAVVASVLSRAAPKLAGVGIAPAVSDARAIIEDKVEAAIEPVKAAASPKP